MDGTELKGIREKMGWTQKELAKRLDVHRLTISRWEQYHVPIPRVVEIVLEKILREGT
ncbi:MAG: helix-turn-helix domain-containing protein [Candidatus Binatia bacterium]